MLIRTPDDQHLMIDGGYKRSKQTSGKNAADLVDWKCVKDSGLTEIRLDAMLATRCDADHYGGLYDILEAGATEELDASSVRVGAFYHAGVARWARPGGGDPWLGPTSPDKQLLTQLLGDRDQVSRPSRPMRIPGSRGTCARRSASRAPSGTSRR